MKLILNFLVTALLVFLVSTYILKEWIVLSDGYTSALFFSIILALVNSTIWFVLRVIGFPINFITLWLFGFFITLLVIWITDFLYSGIEVKWILAHLFIAFLPAMTCSIMWLFEEKKKK